MSADPDGTSSNRRVWRRGLPLVLIILLSSFGGGLCRRRTCRCHHDDKKRAHNYNPDTKNLLRICLAKAVLFEYFQTSQKQSQTQSI